MKNNRKTYLAIAGSFLFLCGVSLYRQISLRRTPESLVRPLIVYAAYVLLLLFWAATLRTRITQRNMRRFLFTEIGIMLFWVSVRLLQDSLLYRSIHLMRVSGYLIVFPLVCIPLLGLYTAFGLGMGEDYRIPKRWLLLVIPDAVLAVLMLTNEHHRFVFRVNVGEEENLEFHANIGIVVILLWATALIVARMAVIYYKTRKIREKPYLKALPLLIGIAMPVIVIPYFYHEFVVTRELIELTAKLYFLEAISWESCILLNLVPVNTQYGAVFVHSTVGMRIISDAGDTLAVSAHARPMTAQRFAELKHTKKLSEDGVELHLHRISRGWLVWQKDVSAIEAVINQLHRTAKKLETENALLSEELAVKSEEAAIQAKNQIYDRLTKEVGTQLALMNRLMQNHENPEPVFRKMCIVGMYIKRRCNLRLIEQQTGGLSMPDVEVSMQDMVSCMEQMGIPAALHWDKAASYTAEFSMFLYDALEFLLEYHDFQITRLDLSAGTNGTFCFTVFTDADDVPSGQIQSMTQEYTVRANRNTDSYQLMISERSNGDVAKTE